MARVVVDIGGSKIRAAIWDQTQTLTQMHECATPKLNSQSFLAELVQFLQPLLQTKSVTDIAIASAGPLNFRRGELQHPANLGDGGAGWTHFPLRDQLAAQTGLPVYLDNDAAMAAWGHFAHFEKRKCANLVVVTLGTGLGVGALVDGRLVRAGQGHHPEAGHLFNVPESLQQKTPRAEHLIAAKPFITEVGLRRKRSWQGPEFLKDARAGQWPDWSEVWQTYASRLSFFVLNLHLLYGPEKIIFAGGFAEEAWPFFSQDLIANVPRLLAQEGLSAFSPAQLELAKEAAWLPLYGAAYFEPA